ncbi:MAG TPA: hypothetical protein VGP65_09340 [Candidatus Angelobacter sp.]|nr:hypothetical protein [Candidatus Angelobacter sp.]
MRRPTLGNIRYISVNSTSPSSTAGATPADGSAEGEISSYRGLQLFGYTLCSRNVTQPGRAALQCGKVAVGQKNLRRPQ